jgi:type IV pilus assembly protein PilX
MAIQNLSVSALNRIRLTQSKQKGMTLLIGLILLAMLTVISVIGFRNTTLSERMTGNSVDRNISFQSAENAGKEAIGVILAGTGAGTGQFNPGVTTGHYDAPIPAGGNSIHWTDTTAAGAGTCDVAVPFNWTSCSASVPAIYSGNKENARFVIERLSSASVAVGATGTNTITTYRITSRSTGASGNAEVVLQTLFTRSTSP